MTMEQAEAAAERPPARDENKPANNAVVNLIAEHIHTRVPESLCFQILYFCPNETATKQD